MDNILDNFFRNDNYNKNICFKFKELINSEKKRRLFIKNKKF
jgi:hypothetical protein